MISVCIPLYNYNAVPLVEALHRQCQQMAPGEVELVCIDDRSTDQWRQANAAIDGMARRVLLEANIGRAAIRNLFLQHTAGQYLLFLDNDMKVGDGFLQRYADTLADGPKVVVGGVAYNRCYNDDAHRLRYLYGTTVESRSAFERNRNPYRAFMTGNFMIERSVLEQIRFDESLHGYGHEDTLFGYRLQQEGVPIVHIDNPAENGQVELNAEFLDKTAEAVANLALLYRRLGTDHGFCQSVRLLKTYERLRRYRAVWLVAALFAVLKKPLRSHFVAGNAITVAQFNFYKLGLLIGCLRKG